MTCVLCAIQPLQGTNVHTTFNGATHQLQDLYQITYYIRNFTSDVTYSSHLNESISPDLVNFGLILFESCHKYLFLLSLLPTSFKNLLFSRPLSCILGN